MAVSNTKWPASYCEKSLFFIPLGTTSTTTTVILNKFRGELNLLVQGLLELLWTVYSEEKLQPCLKLRNFENPFSKNKSVGLKNTMPQKGLKFAPVHKEMRSINFPFPYEDDSRAVMDVKC